MRILICNKFYSRRGGDGVYAMQLEKLLRSRGHEVAVFAMDHPDTAETPWRSYFPKEVSFGSPLSSLRFLARSMGLDATSRLFKKFLAAFNPDVVHVGNIHSQLSPVIAGIARDFGCRVIWTLHDYKLLCPRYDCLRQGKKLCEKCFDNKWNVVRYKCMKNSLAASLAAWMEAERWSQERLESYTDAFICPSGFMLAKMTKGGFNPSKLHQLYNFTSLAGRNKDDIHVREDYFCYVGRLSPEKGIQSLARIASKLPGKLVVVGDGPLRGQLALSPNIVYSGKKDFDSVCQIVRKARFLVLPSVWYENNPLSVIESLCLGTPVLGADIGGIPELIVPGRSGMLFESGNEADLLSKILEMWERDFHYGEIASEAAGHFSPDAYYDSLMKIYSL